jgi:PX domain-containing protein kinase-like protein
VSCAKMNLYFINFRKKEFGDVSIKKHDLSFKKNLKRSKNTCDIHQLAVEHALAYFNKPWDYYLKDKSSGVSSTKLKSCLNDGDQCNVPQKEVNFNSCLMNQRYKESGEHNKKCNKNTKQPLSLNEQKGKRNLQDVLVKYVPSESWKDPFRREPRYDYTALADESFLQERLEMDRKLVRDSDRNMATICCQYYLRGSNRYVFLQHLPDMGSRVGKNWYLVRDSTTKTERLLTMTPVSETCPIKYSSQARQVLLELFLAIQHPYIYPVLDIDRKIIMDQEYVIAVTPFNEEGTLKDIIYQSHCQDDWKDKYHFHGYGLSAAQIQRLGCQILEALLFLKDQKFPPFLHLHSGNVIVQNGVARIAGLENTLFGYSSRLLTLVPKRLQDYKEGIEVISFGHLIFEMASGYELTTSQPSEKNYKDIEHLALVVDVLKFIFEQVRHRHPSLRQIASLEFFRHIDLRELRSLMPMPSIKAKLSSAALSLLKDVKRSQRSKSLTGLETVALPNQCPV